MTRGSSQEWSNEWQKEMRVGAVIGQDKEQEG